MGLGQIQFGGLASGLDTNAIISALLEVERLPILALESQRSTEQSKLNLLGTFEGLVKTLQEKAKGLVKDEGFFARKLEIGDESVASVTAEPNAEPGSHELFVARLAQADRYAFNPKGNPDNILGSGRFRFTYDGTDYDIRANNASLNDVAAAINTEAGDAVQASVINTGTEQSPTYQLVIAGKDTGEDFAIQNLQVQGNLGIGSGDNISPAQNALIELDGLQIERSTNVFSNVLPGITITALSPGLFGETTSFSINEDPSGIKENLSELVDAYNAVIEFINAQSSYDSEANERGGDLFGDSALTSVRSTIQRALFDVDLATVQADTTGYSTLGLVGIQVDSDGLLSIDDAVLDEKLGADLDAFAALFIDEDSGLLGRLDSEIDTLIGSNKNISGESYPGLFERRKDTINSIISDIDGSIERLERRLEKQEEILVARFANLEQLISGLNAQGSYLSSISSSFTGQ